MNVSPIAKRTAGPSQCNKVETKNNELLLHEQVTAECQGNVHLMLIHYSGRV